MKLLIMQFFDANVCLFSNSLSYLVVSMVLIVVVPNI